MTKNQLVTDFDRYIGEHGGKSAGYGWYVGITSDPRRRLFSEHKVDEARGAWIYGQGDTSAIARAVELHYLNAGCQGGGGGGDESSTHVYAYRITWETVE